MTPKLRPAAVAGALALAGTGLGAPAASAGQSEVIDVKGGRVVFQHKGEILKAYAKRATDYGVRAEISRDAPGSVEDHSSDGRWVSKNLSIREGAKLRLRLCYVNHRGAVISCSHSEHAVA
jgi:hypothetical protein